MRVQTIKSNILNNISVSEEPATARQRQALGYCSGEFQKENIIYNNVSFKGGARKFLNNLHKSFAEVFGRVLSKDSKAEVPKMQVKSVIENEKVDPKVIVESLKPEAKNLGIEISERDYEDPSYLIEQIEFRRLEKKADELGVRVKPGDTSDDIHKKIQNTENDGLTIERRRELADYERQKEDEAAANYLL